MKNQKVYLFFALGIELSAARFTKNKKMQDLVIKQIEKILTKEEREEMDAFLDDRKDIWHEEYVV